MVQTSQAKRDESENVVKKNKWALVNDLYVSFSEINSVDFVDKSMWIRYGPYKQKIVDNSIFQETKNETLKSIIHKLCDVIKLTKKKLYYKMSLGQFNANNK